MSSLSVGIVGLPNAGKSTLFNALAARRLAETAPRPFTTIDSHKAVVAVPDEHLDRLYKMILGDSSTSKFIPEKVPATVTFIDIAGLVKDAHKGEGLGNQFLAKIREADSIVHVVRAFSDPAVGHVHATHDPGSLEQIVEDIEVVNLELELGGIMGKPVIFVKNVEEKEIKTYDLRFKNIVKDAPIINICAKLETELIDLEPEERKEYLKELGIERSGLERLIKKAYEILDLITFYTVKGGAEVHAWSLKRGASAIEAAGEVHTDFAKNFIKAEVIEVGKLLEVGSWKAGKELGLIRLEGRDYQVQGGDIIEFKVGI